ncbi:MAG: hypothetical protein PSX79_01395 [bacterium]|nr:hypothetical protein [bacterium]
MECIMPATAYSRYLGKELDVRQLMVATRMIADVNVASLEPSPEQRAWIRGDVLCACCGVSGAIVVREAKRQGRGAPIGQAHFRFPATADGQGDAHRPGCEFRSVDDAPTAPIGGSVDFNSARTKETRLIRDLVCRGIEQRVISQTDIRQMRQWYFEHNTTGPRFRMLATPLSVQRTWEILDLRGRNRSLAFSSAHVGLPGFDWDVATKRQIAFDHLAFSDTDIRFHTTAERDALTRLAQTYQGRDLPDVTAIQGAYRQALAFARLATEYGQLDLPSFKPWEHAPQSPTILAFAALMLFVSGGDMDGAITRLATILAAPPPTDLTLGNVIGLNPYRDYSLLLNAKAISDLVGAGGLNTDMPDMLAATQFRLRQLHQASQPPVPSPG